MPSCLAVGSIVAKVATAVVSFEIQVVVVVVVDYVEFVDDLDRLVC